MLNFKSAVFEMNEYWAGISGPLKFRNLSTVSMDVLILNKASSW
jgi:hypothetical protein